MPGRRYRFILLAGIATLALLAAGARAAFAQQPPPPQIVLSNIRGLDFGRFAVGSGGTLVISAEGVRSHSGGVFPLGARFGQAMFNVSRSGSDGADTAVIICLPPDGTTYLSANGGAAKMAVNRFTDTSASAQLIPDGGMTLSVGATLVVAADQPSGDYSGTFTLIVNYE